MQDKKSKERKATRRPWQQPDFERIKAGSAEVGPNPVVVDGAFTVS